MYTVYRYSKERKTIQQIAEGLNTRREVNSAIDADATGFKRKAVIHSVYQNGEFDRVRENV